MKLSTEIWSAARRIGGEKTLQYLGEAGFDAWDFSMFAMCRYDRESDRIESTDHPLFSADYLSFARKLKRIGEDYGMVCNQSHAPFPTASKKMRPYLKRAIECTAEAGGDICVIHPGNNLSAQENAEMYLDLLPFAKECGVKIATENMWNWNRDKDESSFAACATPESFVEHFLAVNDEDFVACVDIGHAEMRGSGVGAAKTIRALGEKVQALHIHDNAQWKDLHQIPFAGKIDFHEIVRALKEIHYKGCLTLEADTHLSQFAPGNMAYGIRELAQSARKLEEMFEATMG